MKGLLKTGLCTVVVLSVLSINSISSAASSFGGDAKMKLNYKNEEITSMIESFAKASQKTFVVDPSVRGKVSVFAPQPVGLDEAFDLLSTSLALNGYAIVENENKFVVMAARNASRSGIPVSNAVPTVKPERLATWIVTIQNMPAHEAMKAIRTFMSPNSDMNVSEESNQLMITDFTSSLNRMAEALKLIDQPVTAAIAKQVKDGARRRAPGLVTKDEASPKAPTTKN